MLDDVTVREAYKTGRGYGVIATESGKVRGPYTITAVVGDRRYKPRRVRKLGDARAQLRKKLGPLRKAKNPDEVIELMGIGSGSVANPVGFDPFDAMRAMGNPRRKKPSDKLRDMERPTVLGYELDRETLTPKRGTVDTSAPGDYGADPMGEDPDTGEFMFRMVPSGDIVDANEKERRLTARGHRASNPLNWYYFERAGGGLILRKGKPYRVGSLVQAKAEARRLQKLTGVRVRIVREEPDGHQQFVKKTARTSAANPRASSMADADALYESFHGKAPTRTTRVITKTKGRTDFAELGPLVELKVHLLTGKRKTIKFPPDGRDAVTLASSPDGKQLYFIGGNQALDLRDFGMAGDEWTRDSMVLGILEMVTYRTQKGFDNFQLTDYYHELGEESGMQPLLVYDNINQLLSVVGGQYDVRPEGIVN